MNIDTQILFSALANEIRLRCLTLLQLEGELCVCELTHALDMTQPMISRHLALLRESGLVNTRREGQWIYYSVNPSLSKWAAEIIAITARVNKTSNPFAEDLHKLHNMLDRPGSACCA